MKKFDVDEYLRAVDYTTRAVVKTRCFEKIDTRIDDGCFTVVAKPESVDDELTILLMDRYDAISITLAAKGYRGGFVSRYDEVDDLVVKEIDKYVTNVLDASFGTGA